MPRITIPPAYNDKFWKRQEMKRLAWNLFGRSRNCYKLGIKKVEKSMYTSTGEMIFLERKKKQLYNSRLDAALMEHDMERELFLHGLLTQRILLNRKVLVDLAIFEPRTFTSLTDIAKMALEAEGKVDVRRWNETFEFPDNTIYQFDRARREVDQAIPLKWLPMMEDYGAPQ